MLVVDMGKIRGEAGFGEESQAFCFEQVKIKGPFRHPRRDVK